MILVLEELGEAGGYGLYGINKVRVVGSGFFWVVGLRVGDGFFFYFFRYYGCYFFWKLLFKIIF